MTNIMILDVTENIGYSPNSWPLINMMIYQWIELGTLFSDNHFVRKILYLKKDLQEFGGFDDQDTGVEHGSRSGFFEPVRDVVSTAKLLVSYDGTSSESKMSYGPQQFSHFSPFFITFFGPVD